MKPANATSKRVSMLTPEDLAKYPVWKYSRADEQGEPTVNPLSRLPVSNLTGKLVGSKVRLANGKEAWALIGNIDSQNKRLNQHFLTLSVERDGDWFHLARYHDHDYDSRGPEELSRFLGRRVEEVFPIAYDVRAFAIGDADALTGVIAKEPLERLTRAQIIALAVP